MHPDDIVWDFNKQAYRSADLDPTDVEQAVRNALGLQSAPWTSNSVADNSTKTIVFDANFDEDLPF